MDYEDRTFTLLEHMLLDESAEPKDLPLSFLERITKFFSDDRKIGSGGSAVVYKGRLGNGWSVAVKKLFDTINMDEAKYNEEVACLMRVRHENIVRFLGYCADTHGQMWDHEGKFVMADVRHRLLCFEYLHKGSLDCHLTDDASDGLNWRQRYQIIKGICKGLCYLHEKRIVHLDLKPANILLDDDMVPKICDFGISRCFSEEQTRTITSKTAGSIGYMAPESIIDGVITLKSDIYSLGVILKKLLTAQKGPLGDHVLESWRNRLEISLADTRLEQVRVCAEISIHCVNFDPTKRPDIQSIIQKLAETEGSDEYVESCTSTLVAQEEKLSARRFTMTSGAKAPYTSAVSLALMKIDKVLADQTAKSLLEKFCVEARVLEALIQEIKLQLEDVTNISMVYMTNKATVWFQKVQKLAHRVEDLMDKYLFNSCQWKEDELLHKSYFVRRSQFSIDCSQMINELDKIKDEMSRVKYNKPSNLIVPSLQGEKEPIVPFQPNKTERQAEGSFLVKRECLVGIEDNRRMLTEWLYSDKYGITVITVSGMSGSGKTDLVANVYGHEKTNFSAHAWIDVSQTYNVEALLRQLLREISYMEENPSADIEKMDVYDLKLEIRRRLKDKKCLIVLDDVWNQDVYFQMFKEFKNTMATCMIITTRKDHVAALAFPTRRLGLKSLVLEKHEESVGIEDNRRMLTDWLYSDEKSTVITVSGMGGSGKTVLAANVYRREMTNFPAHAWIFVSKTYNMEAVLRKLLREIGFLEQHSSAHIEKMDVYDLKVEIRRSLKDRKCLIVLDDVWNQEVYFQMFNDFKNSQTCRIIITTRKNYVAALAPPTRRLDLKPLGYPQAFNLFCRIAFQENVCPMNLEKFATSIVARCEGLPLAIVTIGRVLSSRGRTDDIWGDMFYQVRNELSNNDNIREILNPIYNDLSGDIKNCFLYCCLFPEDYIISCESLMRLWVAEGFVQSSDNSTAEEVAERNLMELIDNNLLIVRQNDEQGRIVFCAMHGILRDLACAVAKKEKFEFANDYSSMLTINRNVRRLSLCRWNDNRTLKTKFSYLRTLVSLGTISSSPCMLSSIFSGSNYLTVIELQDSEITELPESIGALFNLRYIGLRHTKVKSLPDSVCKLHNLQTLDIKQTKMQNLPRVICKVKNLQHLFAGRSVDEKQDGFPCIFGVQPPMGLSDISEVPCNFGVEPPNDLSNLEFLETFETVQATMNLPGQLKNLRRLRNVWIDNISTAYCTDLFATLSNMPLLSSLLLFATDGNQALCFEALRPVSTKLQKVVIRGQCAPGTLECPIFIVYGRYIKYLSLSCCLLLEDPLKMLAPHLPNLAYLKLDNIHTPKTLVLPAGSLAHLKTLVLKQMPIVNQLVISDGSLQCIDALYIMSLAELDMVPQGLELIRSLKKLWLLNLHSGFRAQWDQNGMHQKMQHVLEIRI